MNTVLLIGQPNTGKSSLFNLLSGKYRKVSNYSGITVDRGEGEIKQVIETTDVQSNETIRIVDLPGIYTLDPQSLDEAVTISSLLSADNKLFEYDKVLVVVDFQRIVPSLVLALELKELLGDRCLVIVNKVDDPTTFSEKQRLLLAELLGMQVLTMCALTDSISKVEIFLRSSLDDKKETVILKKKLAVTEKALSFLPEHKDGKHLTQVASEQRSESILKLHYRSREIADKVLGTQQDDKVTMTQKIDRFLIHPLWGSIAFFLVFYILFHSVYTFAVPFMDIIDSSVSQLGSMIGELLPAGMLKSLLVDGIIAGVGGVIIFLPQIMILFFLLALLEQSGYISRAAFLADRVMSVFGLSGKAFLPYLSGLACSVPAIMAARTISSKKERIATMVTIPFITCSARLPVYLLLVGTFIPDVYLWGPFHAQALSFLLLYFLGTFFALFMAMVFRLSFFKGESISFFMDFPLYQRPSIKAAVKQMLWKAKIFLKKAGTIILALSIVIWFASSYPKSSADKLQGMNENEVAAITLENSFLGSVGKTIEPVLKPIGMNWKMGIGLLVAFGARELFVSTMGTIYALGDVDEESTSLQDRLRKEINPLTGKPIYNMAVVWSLLIFFVFALQCISTVAILKNEIGTWKAASLVFLYMGVMAYAGSFMVYNFLA